MSIEGSSKIIYIDHIIFTKELINAIKSRGGKIPKVLVSKEFTTPLNRIEAVMNLIDEGVFLPPIIVKRLGTTDYYELIDGRHRVAIAILLNQNEILARII